VTIQLHSASRPLTLPYQTPTKVFKSSYTWNNVITLPTTYASLPRDARLGVTVWDIGRANVGKAVGGSTLELFSKKG
jgi:phosphatidylinositol 3-kinase